MSPAIISALIGAGVALFLALVGFGGWLFRSGKTWSRIENGIDTLRSDVAEIKQTTSANTKDIGDLKTATEVHKVEISAIKTIIGHFTVAPVVSITSTHESGTTS